MRFRFGCGSEGGAAPVSVSTAHASMHHRQKGRRMVKRSLLVVGFPLCMASIASAADVTVSEQTFGCIVDWPQVRNTRINHADPNQPAEGMRLFQDRRP